MTSFLRNFSQQFYLLSGFLQQSSAERRSPTKYFYMFYFRRDVCARGRTSSFRLISLHPIYQTTMTIKEKSTEIVLHVLVSLFSLLVNITYCLSQIPEWLLITLVRMPLSCRYRTASKNSLICSGFERRGTNFDMILLRLQ